MRISDFGPPWRGFVKKVCWHGSISEEGHIEPQQLESGLGQGLRNQFKCCGLRVSCYGFNGILSYLSATRNRNWFHLSV